MQSDVLRTVDLSRAANLSTQQVRNYEAWGFLPQASRTASGYRIFTHRHLQALEISRTLIAGYGWQKALEAMQAIHQGDTPRTHLIAASRHGELQQMEIKGEQLMLALYTIADGNGRTSDHGTPSILIGDLAALIGVQTSTIRFWEKRCLLQSQRDKRNRYRLYNAQEVRKLQLVAFLRRANYSFEDICLALTELARGDTQKILAAIEEWRKKMAIANLLFARANTVLHKYSATFTAE